MGHRKLNINTILLVHYMLQKSRPEPMCWPDASVFKHTKDVCLNWFSYLKCRFICLKSWATVAYKPSTSINQKKIVTQP